MRKWPIIVTLLVQASYANAATCFWVGGTGTWSTTNTASWASASGGTAGSCAATGGVPKQSADSATFDGASGGGTVTVDSSLNGASLTSITMGAFTGTLDFSVNNPSLTLSGTFSVSGSGTRTLKLGSSTLTFTAANGSIWNALTTSGLTFNAGTSTIATSGDITANGSRTLTLGSLSYATISIGSPTTHAGQPTIFSGVAPTIATLDITAPANVYFASSTTTTITNAFNWAGTSSSQIGLFSTSNVSPATISVASGAPTISWAAIGQLTFTGGATFTANSSFNLNGNSGITISSPTGGSSGRIIGG